jgi:hypothetical protein
MLYSVCPESLSFRDRKAVKWGNSFRPCYLSRRYVKRIARCTQGTQRTAGLGSGRVIMEHTHDEHCDMLSNLSAGNSRTGTAGWEYALCYHGRHRPDAPHNKLWDLVKDTPCPPEEQISL